MNRSLHKNLLAVVIACLLPAAVQGREASPVAGKDGAVRPSENEMLELSLEELSKVRIITSTLQEETPQSVPSSITVFSRTEIRQLGISTLEELMNYVPGYQSSRSDDSGFIHAYSSRGRRNGSTGREVLVLLDGNRFNSDFSGGAGFFDPLMSLDNVERVEFIRGPGSSIYGSNAIMGVINVITRNHNELSAKLGSNQRREASAQWRIGNDSHGLQLFAKHGREDGESLSLYNADPLVRDYVDTRDPLEQSEAYLRAYSGEFNASARWSQRTGEQFYSSGYIANDVNEVQAESIFASLGWDHEFTQAISLQAKLFHSDRHFDLHTMIRSTPLVLTHAQIYERELGAELLLHGGSGPARWLLGSEYRRPDLYNSTIDPSSVDPSPALNDPSEQVEEGHRTIRGYFGQYQRDFKHGTSIILGLRHDAYSDVGHRASPRIGVIQQLNRRDTVKLLYAEAFRAPNRAATGSINSPFLLGNPDLKPEVAKTAELVWMRTLNRGQVAVSLFDTQMDNAIHEVAIGNTSRRTWLNESESVSGVEIEWKSTWSEHWSTRLAVTDIFDESSEINSESSTLLAGAIVYQQAQWLASVRANYQGDREDAIDTDGNAANGEYLAIGGHTVMAAHVSWHVMPAVELYVTINNLLDKEYVAPAVRYALPYGVPERGRTASIGVNWEF